MVTEVIAVGAVLVCAIWAWRDWTQTEDNLRRNFPLIARINSLSPWLSQWLRLHVLDGPQDTQSKPFSTIHVNYIKDASSGVQPHLSFGIGQVSEPLFRFKPSKYAYLSTVLDEHKPSPQLIGARAEYPYQAHNRLMVSALSFGALSDVAVESISAGAADFGTLYNVGEGGLSASQRRGGADLILQVGTAKFCVGDHEGKLHAASFSQYRTDPNIKMIEIKLAQGASPGRDGGFLPGSAMNEEYAKSRGRLEGHDVVAPSRHPEIGSDLELIEMITRIRRESGRPVGIKIVISYLGQWDELWTLLEDRMQQGDLMSLPDFISLDGGEGGTTRGSYAFMAHMGLELHVALPHLQQRLTKHGLRPHLTVIASGKLSTPERAAMAFCLGADMVAVARGVMFSLGCVQAMRCTERTCPSGIATHDRRLTRAVVPQEKRHRVNAYLSQLHKDTVAIAHACGVQCYDQLTSDHIVISQRVDTE
jgi:glutamate synthase domain-containing protein 2